MSDSCELYKATQLLCLKLYKNDALEFICTHLYWQLPIHTETENLCSECRDAVELKLKCFVILCSCLYVGLQKTQLYTVTSTSIVVCGARCDISITVVCYLVDNSFRKHVYKLYFVIKTAQHTHADTKRVKSQ